MQNKLSTSTNPRTARLRSALIMSVVLLFLLQVTSLSYAVPQKSKKGTFGTIRLMAIPDGSPIRIDGLPVGETTELPRLLDLAPGLHTLEIRFPNNQRWTRKIKVVSEQTVCIALSYRPGPPPGSPPGSDPEPTPSSEASNPQPTSSPAARSLSGGESFDLTFSDGSRLAGTIGGCGLTAVPRALPGSKKTTRKTRRTN